MLTLIILCSIGVGNAWGANPATGSWTFNSALAKGWTKVENGESYCGGWGCKKKVESYTVRTTDNVSDFTTILTDPSNSKFSLTITVTGVCNSGTNKCTVTLLNSSNTKVGSLEQTKLDGFGSGTSAKAAKDVVFTFAPTSTVARIQVIGYNKTAITKVSYSLSYTSGPECSDPATALSISASPASITTDGTSTLSTTGGNGGTVTYTITSANASSASIVENTFSATAAGTYTVQASQDENGGTCGGTASTNITVTLPTRTVTWMVNGSEHATTQVADGSKPEFPSNPSSCDGTSTTFVGWTPTPWSGKLDDVSAKTIYTSGSAMPNVSGPVTYHAVFAKETSTLTPVPNTWTRITSTSQLTDGATVMLVQYNSDFAINNTPGATSCTAYDEITNSNTDLRWIAVKSGSKWKFKTSGGAYLSTNDLANNTNLGLDQTYDEWTISADAGGYSNCFNLNNGNDLEYYSGAFKLYKWSLNYKSAFPFYIYIQKTTGSTTYSQYLTTCCTNNVPAPTVIATNTAYTVTLTWAAVDGATGYEVSWNGGAFEAATSPCVKSGLTASTDYIYKVRATYDPLVKCGALVASGNVTTDDVYSVTYSGGTGTGSCSPSGSVAPVSYEAGATVTLAATNSFSLTSNTFAAWVVKDAENNDVAVSNNQFTMPASNVTVTATWTAVQDKYYDRMHQSTDASHGGIADGNGKYYIVREGCNYTVPSPADDSTGDTDCHTTHFKLLGWIAQSHLKSDGSIKDGEESHLFQGGTIKSATGATYYAIYAIMTE